jgi:MarR family transcriptional regulator, 2-MHQ and catechol-resistance regulon repressor
MPEHNLNQQLTSEPAEINGAHAWLVLYKAFKAVEGNALRSIEACDMCISDFAVLEVLLHKGPTPINRIAKKVLLTSGSITALVDRLEKRRLLERFDDPADRRIRLVRLTDSGRTLIEQAFAEHEKDLDAAVSALDRQELATLVSLLKKLGYGAEARLTSNFAADTQKPTEGAR